MDTVQLQSEEKPWWAHSMQRPILLRNSPALYVGSRAELRQNPSFLQYPLLNFEVRFCKHDSLHI